MDVFTNFAATLPSFSGALSLLAIILGVVGLAGGAVGYFAKGRGDSIIAYQSNEIQLRDGTIARLEKEKTELVTNCAAKEEAMKQLKQHNEYLQKLAQGSPQLKKLTTAIENQTKVIAQTLGKKNNA